MSISQKFRLIYSVSVAVITLLVAAVLLASWNQSRLNESQLVRYQSYQLAQELRQTSDHLTRTARTYVVTGDAQYERQYWDILAVRNGQKPRPDGRQVSMRALMEQLGSTAAEFARLKEAEDNSNALVRTETIAMNAVKGRFADDSGNFTRQAGLDLELARRIMHDAQYHKDKEIIMRPIDEFQELLDARTRAAVDAYAFRGNLFLGLIAAGVLLMAASACVTLRSVNAVLRATADELSRSADQVAASANQIAGSCTLLAQGASDQAASLEETSASTEEIGSMTRQNAERARCAADLAVEAKAHVRDANAALNEMTASMKEIGDSSSEIARIIRVIDEIAFQTNILALNAAVEAARAGDAGMGFAVVAEEVRNFVQRSAQAARDTTALIEESINRQGREGKWQTSARIDYSHYCPREGDCRAGQRRNHRAGHRRGANRASARPHGSCYSGVGCIGRRKRRRRRRNESSSGHSERGCQPDEVSDRAVGLIG